MRGFLFAVPVAVLLFACAQKRAVIAAPAPPPVAKVRAAPSVSDAEEFAGLLHDVVLRFDFDAAELDENGKQQLQRVGEALRERPWATIRIAGHCDERGTEEYNLALGQRRADVARKYLLALGVDPAAVETVSFGAELPVAFGTTEEEYSQNRRDELHPVTTELLGMAE
ncbi:MAG: OmpA family protein [Myxococcota bacterium]